MPVGDGNSSLPKQTRPAKLPSGMQQNWDNGIYRRFEIPSVDHLDEAHEDVVYSIHLRGSLLVSCSRDKSIRIWNVETQRLFRPPLLSHEGSVLCVQFDDTSGQDVIISGGTDSALVVWRFSTGEILKKVDKAHQESILSLCFDDQHLVTASKDKTIKIWNRLEVQKDSQTMPAYSELRMLTGHVAAVNTVKLQGNTIVSGGGDRMIHIWDIQTGQMLRTLRGHTFGIASLQYRGNLVVSGSSDRTTRIFDLEEPEDQAQIACLEGHSNLVRSVQVQWSGEDSSKMERILTGSYDETVKTWMYDASSTSWKSNLTLSLQNPSTGNENRVFSVQVDERRLVCCSQSNIITGWDFSSSI